MRVVLWRRWATRGCWLSRTEPPTSSRRTGYHPFQEDRPPPPPGGQATIPPRRTDPLQEDRPPPGGQTSHPLQGSLTALVSSFSHRLQSTHQRHWTQSPLNHFRSVQPLLLFCSVGLRMCMYTSVYVYVCLSVCLYLPTLSI